METLNPKPFFRTLIDPFQEPFRDPFEGTPIFGNSHMLGSPAAALKVQMGFACVHLLFSPQLSQQVSFWFTISGLM